MFRLLLLQVWLAVIRELSASNITLLGRSPANHHSQTALHSSFQNYQFYILNAFVLQENGSPGKVFTFLILDLMLGLEIKIKIQT